MLLQAGQIVYSKAGRDHGTAFVVVATDGDYAYIVDGESRVLTRPKKKKSKHIQPTNYVDIGIAARLVSGAYVNDAEIVKLLKAYHSR